jgi:hypothetical protein
MRAGHLRGLLIARFSDNRRFDVGQSLRLRRYGADHETRAIDPAVREPDRRCDIDEREVPHLTKSSTKLPEPSRVGSNCDLLTSLTTQRLEDELDRSSSDTKRTT